MLRKIKIFDWPLVLCLALAPVQWLTLHEIAGASLEPFHLPILLVIVLTFLTVRRVPDIATVIQVNLLWIIPFLVYISMLAISLTYSRFGGGEHTIFRAIVGFLLCCAVAARIIGLRNIGPSLYLGSLLALVLYYFVLFLSSSHLGFSMFEKFYDFAASGDFTELTYGFFRPVFNAFHNDGPEFRASLRNNISCSLLLSFIFFQIGASTLPRHPMVRLFNLLFSIIILINIIAIQSRSVIASLLLSVTVVSWFVRRKILALHLYLSIFILIVGCFLVQLWIDTPLFSGVYERLILDTKSYSDRIKDYLYGIRLVDQNIMFGVGYYNTSFDGHFRPHNLFLAAWTQAGVLAFVASALFVGGFLVVWFSAILACLYKERAWLLPSSAAWVMALPMMAMFRLWSSGDGGNLNFPAWLSMGVFLGLVLSNLRARARYGDWGSVANPRQHSHATPSLAAGRRSQFSSKPYG